MSNPDLALAESVSTNASYFVFVYILILIYCCFGLAVVCDVYFVPALQKLSITYDLPPDIAGSTLMALGASVPELFASLIGVFVTEDDIGTGSIIGSSCFNLIAVPAACAFVASASFSTKLKLQPMPVTRNSAFYAITILVLLLIIKDNKVDIPESIILLLFFVMYMAFMIFSAKLERKQRVSLQQHQISNKESYISSTDSAIADSCNSSSSSNDSSIRTKKDSQYSRQNLNNNGEIIRQNNNYHEDKSIKYHHFKTDLSSYNYKSELGLFGNKSNRPSQLFASQGNLNERTPLASAKSLNGKSILFSNGYSTVDSLDERHSTNLASQQQVPSDNDNNNNNKMITDSFRLNLGIAIKNSSCLIKNNTDDVVVNFIAGNDKSSLDHRANYDVENGSKIHNQIMSNDINHNEESNWVSSKWILVPMFPLTLSMRVLMPRKLRSTFWTIWTFVISVTVIGGLTYVSVWMVHSLGQCLGIPETVAGMTILSWGTGVPELIASIVLIRKTAEADMAISNTIGSNVIDVSFCLSVPWIVKCLMNKSYGLEPIVDIQSVALPWTSFLLVIAVILLLIILKTHDWTLCVGVGVWLSLVYVAFVLGAITLEYSIGDRGIDWMAILRQSFAGL